MQKEPEYEYSCGTGQHKHKLVTNDIQSLSSNPSTFVALECCSVLKHCSYSVLEYKWRGLGTNDFICVQIMFQSFHCGDTNLHDISPVCKE